jgi:TRAP-type C4-dicarboxylate transport system permease large subunit
MLSLQKLLMAINIYNATYCALLVVFNLWTGNEPMASLQESNEADYLILQFCKCVAYLVFVLIQVVHVSLLIKTKAENMKVAAIGNLLLSLCIGLHYYLRVWSPAMAGHPPRTSQLSYMLYTVMFAAMAFSHYVKPDKGERAEAAAAENIMGGDGNKQF